MNNSGEEKVSTAPRVFPAVPPEERRKIADDQAKEIKKKFLEIQELVRQGKPLPKVY